MSTPPPQPTEPSDPDEIAADPKRTKHRRPWALRLVNVLAGLVAVVVLGVSVGGYVVVKWFDSSISRVHINLTTNRPAAAPVGTENWLLVGTDSRAGSDGEFGSVDGQRSDTTILAHLDADGTTTMVSFPRDMLVSIPAYTDSTGKKFPARMDKFTNAILEGGPSLLVATVQKLTGIPIDHYVSVDLEGFKKISEVLNGVNVCIKPAPASADEDNGALTNINDGYSGFHGKYGEQKVAGDSAVAFVRQRHGLPDGDISRIQRQQQFLGSVFREATQNGVLFNPVAITHLLGAVRDAITLDQNTSLSDLEKLAIRMRGVGPNKLLFETVPQRGLEFSDTDLGSVVPYQGLPNGIPTLIPNGQSDNVGSVQVIEQPQFNQMLASLRDETPTTSSSGTKFTPSTQPIKVNVAPSDVQVTVQDGVGKVGLANQVTAALDKQGYQTGAPGPADSTGYSKSVVLYSPANQEEARTVATAIPGSIVEEDPTATNGVVLIVGQNYTTVQPVSIDGTAPVTTTPTPTPSTSISPLPAPTTADSASNECTY